MPTFLERTLPWILVFALLMVAMIGYFALQNSRALDQAIKWEKKTQTIILALDETLAGATDVETGGRGFVITRDDAFLKPFEDGRRTTLESLQNLRDLLGDSPAQDEQLSSLDRAVREKIRYTERYVAYRRTLDLEKTVVEMRKAEELDVMDSIRSLVAAMKAEELRLLKTREDNLRITLANNYWMMVTGTVAGTVSLGLAVLVVLFEMRKRALAERALREANVGLERRVEERTDELRHANLQLLKSADEREFLLRNEQSARREAEIANRQRDEFMAMISHELRTPLNSILGWAQILKGGGLDETTRAKAVDTIIAGAENQSRLIRDLLDVARIISGKLNLERVSLSPLELLRGAIEAVKPLAEQKSIPIGLSFDEHVRAVRIDADPNRLRQVFLNLLTNAVKFTADGGKIDISLRASGDQMTVIVADSGIGIKPEFLPFAFERFRQETGEGKRASGLGLGLAIVRYLVEMHGGTVRVESEGEGRGATFTVDLPVSETGSSGVGGDDLVDDAKERVGNEIGRV